MPSGRLDSCKGIDKCIALIDEAGRSLPAQPPAVAGSALLAKSGFILEKQPDPFARVRLPGRGETVGQLIF